MGRLYGFEMETEDEPIYHSFWKKQKFIFSKEVSPEEIEKLFKKGKRALELKHVELPTAEQTEKLANAAAKVVESLDKFEEGIVRLGSLLVLKKKIDGEEEEDFPSQARPDQRYQSQQYAPRRSGEGRRSADRERYDADPQVLGDDFSALELRDAEGKSSYAETAVLQ